MSIQGQVTCRTKWILQEKQLVWLVLPTKEVDIKSKIQTDFLSIIHYDDHDLKMRLTKEKKIWKNFAKIKVSIIILITIITITMIILRAPFSMGAQCI